MSPRRPSRRRAAPPSSRPPPSGTPPRCSVCAHPDVEKITKGLRGGRTLDAIAKRWPKLSRSALHRHAANGHDEAPVSSVRSFSTPDSLSSASAPATSADDYPSLASLPRAMSHEDWCDALERAFQETVLRLARPTEDLSEIERSKLRAEALGQLTQLQKLRGRTQFTEAQLLRTAAFRRAVKAIVETLNPWPDAMAALRDKLLELGEEQGPA